jgi:putative FmdB family regulatory protein
MPLFEYICRDCGKRFEALVFGRAQARCPLCQSENLDQQISVFSVGSARPGANAGGRPSQCAQAGASCGGSGT